MQDIGGRRSRTTAGLNGRLQGPSWHLDASIIANPIVHQFLMIERSFCIQTFAESPTISATMRSSHSHGHDLLGLHGKRSRTVEDNEINNLVEM